MVLRGEQMFQDDEDMFSNKKEHRNPLVLCGTFLNPFRVEFFAIGENFGIFSPSTLFVFKMRVWCTNFSQ
jgi:hypothetical protein